MTRARLLAAAGGLVLVTVASACSVHPRVWQNGAAMSSSRAYQDALMGDHSFQTQRRLYQSATPLRAWSRDVPYAPFGRW